MLRTHTCGELRKEDVKKPVILWGWVDQTRDLGGLIFWELRDRYGKTRVVFSRDSGNSLEEGDALLQSARQVPPEGMVCVEGIVLRRPEGSEDRRSATGEIEIRPLKMTFWGPGEVPSPKDPVSMGKRRQRLLKIVRDYADSQGFLEGNACGAAEMAAGFDRCLRITEDYPHSENVRLDIEMALAMRDDLCSFAEGLLSRLFQEMRKEKRKTPFARISRNEALEGFGSDVPDERLGRKLVDLTDLASECTFRVFREAADSGNRVRAWVIPDGAADFSRGQIDTLTHWVQETLHGQGLAWLRGEAGSLNAPIAKHFDQTMLSRIQDRLEMRDGDIAFFAADTFPATNRILNGLRLHLGKERMSTDPDLFSAFWVVEGTETHGSCRLVVQGVEIARGLIHAPPSGPVPPYGKLTLVISSSNTHG